MTGPASHTAEVTCPATVEHLPKLLALLDRTAAEAGIDDEIVFPLHLATEEACTNVIMHAYPDAPGPLTLRVEITPETVAVVLADEAPTFDPSSAPSPPLDGSVEERPIGGLGWHLIREVTDEIRHETPRGGGNRLTLLKHRTSNPPTS